MTDDKFRKLSPEEALPKLATINEHYNGSDFDVDQSIVMVQDLSFYPGYEFLDIADHNVSPIKRAFVIYKPGEAPHFISWANDVIYRLNDSVPIQLGEDNIEDYVRFYFDYVRGPKGKFILVDYIDDIPWKDDPPPSARKAIGKMLSPVQLLCVNNDGHYEIAAQFVFKNTLLKAIVIITETGRVAIEDEEILIDDLPVIDDLFGQ